MHTPILQLRDVHFRWPNGQRNVLEIADLAIQPGERVFVKGPSGSGKTTLLSVLGGINSPQSGQVEVLNHTLHSLSASQKDQFRADHIGFVFQLFNLIPYLNVRENIELSCKFSRIRLQRVKDKGCTVQDEIQRLLEHLDLRGKDLLNKPVMELSIGQQQRVATARALIGAPELIIADEPTSALDADTRERFLRLLMDECQSQGLTLLFVSHDSTLETLFDRSIALNELNGAHEAIQS